MVYYVEDDTNIRELTVYALTQAGIAAKGCADDAEFRQACSEEIPDVVLLDIMLPDTDGMAILARTPSLTPFVRSTGVPTTILPSPLG